jgi:hypothetical protein
VTGCIGTHPSKDAKGGPATRSLLLVLGGHRTAGQTVTGDRQCSELPLMAEFMHVDESQTFQFVPHS